jgi:hypothetical protein
VLDEMVPSASSEDPDEVSAHSEFGRPLAASVSVGAIALLIVGLLYASRAGTTSDSAARLPLAVAAATARAAVAGAPRPAAPASTIPASPPATPTSAPLPTDSVAGPIGPMTRPVVVLYGDSLAWEARHAFTESFAAHPGVEVHTRTFGGTAICDWLEHMAADATFLSPGIVVVEFSGNSFTACMHDVNGVPLTGAAVDERYAADAASVIATFTPIGARIVLAGAPLSGPDSAAVGRLNDMYRELADDHDGVWYADAGSAVLADDGYTITLPCLSSEPCEGGYNSEGLAVNVVRSPDGVHFCPVSGDAVQGITDSCPVWSSGAHRYGRALAQPVLDSLAVSSFE